MVNPPYGLARAANDSKPYVTLPLTGGGSEASTYSVNHRVGETILKADEEEQVRGITPVGVR